MNYADKYQEWTRTTAIYPKDTALEYVTLGLCSEAGEVAGKLKKIIRDNRGIITSSTHIQLVDELADVMWYVARLSDELDVHLSDLMMMNQTKLNSRKARGTIMGSGDNR